MAKVLYIKANPKPVDQSVTFQMSEAFVDTYKKEHPEDEITTIDLYNEDIRFLSEEDLGNMFGGKDFDIRERAKQFAEADKYIIAAPLWNLSIPAILKAYIDYVMFVGISFKYTVTGPVGLLDNKKAVYLVARGGDYTTPQMADIEMGERYLRTVLGFMDIKDIETIACENTNVLLGDALTDAIHTSVEQAKKSAKSF
ncbi:FMN-dependent NADH-azoreductase [Breznakia blatticola]|uniref:FMN dependent NADH:quinone oxidoreductase n=1 Tax=Breznakia blatticola TaxID=1754012 RepID=A0A4R7Z895_9FIRM|nr:NAD(P)H-dependent oxidoreductase [Breznakia blatticola]TDW08852.1 FMN-dependent NADH-azoreductase [Breznakia blatticola]